MTNTSALQARYLPLPQPRSRPTAAGGSAFRNRSTSGHGYSGVTFTSGGAAGQAHLVARRGEVVGNVLVDAVHMRLLVGRGRAVFTAGHDLLCGR